MKYCLGDPDHWDPQLVVQMPTQTRTPSGVKVNISIHHDRRQRLIVSQQSEQDWQFPTHEFPWLIWLHLGEEDGPLTHQAGEGAIQGVHGSPTPTATDGVVNINCSPRQASHLHD
jgi:hypothetical protein